MAVTIWLGNRALIAALLAFISRRVHPSTFDVVATAVSLLALWVLLVNWAAGIPRSQGLDLVASTPARWFAALVMATALALLARRLRIGRILILFR